MRGFSILGLERRDLLIVIVAFLASQALYALLGVRFDDSTLPGYMQFIAVDLLMNRLLESLWYYHAHPPLLNVFAAVGLKLFGERADIFFSGCFHLLGLVVAFCVYALTLRLSNSRIAAGVTTTVLVFSPAFVLYENWLMYTFPSMAMLTLSALLLHQYVVTSKAGWCMAFFGVLSALLLTRSLFHLLWLVSIVLLLAVVLWDRRRQVLMAAAVPLLIVVFWYGKNYVLFGTFSSSSLMGLGFSNITTLMVPRPELRRLIDAGELSPYALVSRYQDHRALFAEPEPATGIPVLDEITKAGGAAYNFNNVRMVRVNQLYAHDGLQVIRHLPGYYVMGLAISNRIFFSPPAMNWYFTQANLAAARPMDRIFNPLLYGARPDPQLLTQPHFGLPSPYTLQVNTGIPLIVLWWVVIAYAFQQARRGVRSGWPDVDARAVVLGFFAFTALYLYVVGTGLELAENFRYRYNIEPLLFAVTAAAVTHLIRAARGRLQTAPVSAS